MRTVEFAKWLIEVGRGCGRGKADNEGYIRIPPELGCTIQDSNLEHLLDAVYGTKEDLEATWCQQSTADWRKWISGRAILTPKNSAVDDINDIMCNRFPGDGVEVYSVDSLVPGQEEHNITVEFLNSLNVAGVATHKLFLKPGMPVMLLRNLDPGNNLCNGTRLIVQSVSGRLLKVKHAELGTVHFLPMKGKCGAFLPDSVFSHGQLYVVASRATNPSNLILAVEKVDTEGGGFTRNVVYEEIFT